MRRDGDSYSSIQAVRLKRAGNSKLMKETRTGRAKRLRLSSFNDAAVETFCTLFCREQKTQTDKTDKVITSCSITVYG